jgi:serine O-acetyltransferase
MFFKGLKEDLDSYLERDPAARSRFEVALCYPGFHALLFYWLSHGLWKRGWRISGRLVSQIGRALTGIEIHPGAEVGRRFVIDHGAGVVIGETSIIGDDVTLYQAVTLGGTSPSVDSKSQVNEKRHPTLGDGVIIGSGAQVLGPIMVGMGARVGANAVVTKDLPPGVTAVGIPARVVMPRDKAKAKEFVAYGTPAEGCPDPVLRSIEDLRGQLAATLKRIDELEDRVDDNEQSVPGKRPVAASGE